MSDYVYAFAFLGVFLFIATVETFSYLIIYTITYEEAVGVGFLVIINSLLIAGFILGGVI